MLGLRLSAPFLICRQYAIMRFQFRLPARLQFFRPDSITNNASGQRPIVSHVLKYCQIWTIIRSTLRQLHQMDLLKRTQPHRQGQSNQLSICPTPISCATRNCLSLFRSAYAFHRRNSWRLLRIGCSIDFRSFLRLLLKSSGLYSRHILLPLFLPVVFFCECVIQ